MDDLGRAFLDLAVERKLLTVEARDQVEAACARAAGEKQPLTPWRAAFVRGLIARAEIDSLLAVASKKVEENDGDSSIALLGSSADDEALDHRLGVLALQTRVVSEEQLDVAVQAQRRERKAGRAVPKLGDALVLAGVSPRVMEGLLILQERVRGQGRDDSKAEAIAADLRFGQVALDARLLSERDLERGLAEQERRAARGRAVESAAAALGHILVEMGALTREARDLILELQERRAARQPAPPPSKRAEADEVDKIGRILVESRVVSEQQVAAAITLQREIAARGISRKLGDLLVLTGAIDRSTLEPFLRTQTLRRKQQSSVRRRSPRREIDLPDHPLTTVAALALAFVLGLVYLLAVDGAGAIHALRGG